MSKPQKKPPTLRELAKIAGVSAMTISRALRNHREISEPQRERILKLAEEHGYRPDPEIRKLMHHLRKNHSSRLQGCICVVLSSAWLKKQEDYCTQILKGARSRANELGFSWQIYPLEEVIGGPKQFSRIMIQRGVNGLLLPPMAVNCRLPEDVEWNEFSVVAATHSVLSPVFHSVVPNHFQNTMLICKQLLQNGYKRIGLCLMAGDEARSQFQFSSAIAGFCHHHQLPFLPPLHLSGGNYATPNLKEWVDCQRPDVIVLNGEPAIESVVDYLKLKIPQDIMLVSTDCHSDRWAGINQLPESVGSIAVEILSSMMIHNDKGIPTHTRVVMANGSWQSGKTSGW